MKRRGGELRRQGRRAAPALLPLLGAGVYHLFRGGSVVLYVAAVGAVAVAVLVDVGRHRRDVAVHEREATVGRHVWPASITTDSLQQLASLPRVLFLWDVIPIYVEVDDESLVMTPPRRYRWVKVGEQRVPLGDIRRLYRHVLGHVRPDGTLSTRSVLAISVVLKRGSSFDLVFDVGGNDFRGALQRAVGGVSK